MPAQKNQEPKLELRAALAALRKTPRPPCKIDVVLTPYRDALSDALLRGVSLRTLALTVQKHLKTRITPDAVRRFADRNALKRVKTARKATQAPKSPKPQPSFAADQFPLPINK